MNLKIVSEGSGEMVSLSNLSRHLLTNSDIYLLEEDKEILLGFVNHSLLVYFAVEFADYALKNYSEKRLPQAEKCISLTRKWIEDHTSVSKDELDADANAAYHSDYAYHSAAASSASAAAAYSAYTATNATATAAYAANSAATSAAYAGHTAAYTAYTASAAKEFERQGRFILIVSTLMRGYLNSKRGGGMRSPILPCVTHDDEELALEYEWCPNCGCNAYIITWESKIGKRYRCQCGLFGRFGDGLSEPTTSQPETTTSQDIE